MGLDNTYTPFHKETGVRIMILLSDEDMKKMTSAGRNTRVKGNVTDLNTGTRYRIQGASCGAPHCLCDASAQPLESVL